MKQQFSMSFRLQRQRGTRPAQVNTWLGLFLLISVGVWYWVERSEARGPFIPPVPSPVIEQIKVVSVPVPAITPVVPKVATAPAPNVENHTPVRIAQGPKRHPLKSKAERRTVQTAMTPYLFVFRGRAISDAKPCPNTHILVRLQDGDRSRVAHTVTDGDGYYSIPVSITMNPKSSIDWTLEAARQDYQSLEMSGRHIAIGDDTTVTVERSFDLALR